MEDVRAVISFFLSEICFNKSNAKVATARRKFTKVKNFSNAVMRIPSFPEGKDTLRNSEGNRLPFKVCLARMYRNTIRHKLQLNIT